MTVTLDLAALKTDAHIRRTISDLSLSVAKCKRIVVVTGAGISCSCGIPVSFYSESLFLVLICSPGLPLVKWPI
jgi:NAD-dependent histone deacetylase SIR2